MDILHLIDRMDELVGNGIVVPLSGKVLLDREELLALVDQIRATIPEDVQHAAEVLRSQEELYAEARAAAQRIRDEAEAAFKQRLDQHELTLVAKQHAQELATKAQQQVDAQLAQVEEEIAVRRKELDEYSLTLLRRLEANLTGQIANVRSGIEGIMEGSRRGPGGRSSMERDV